MTTPEQKFIEALTDVAELCAVPLTRNIIGLYAAALGPYGFDNAAMALTRLAVDCRPNYGFPTIRQLLEILDPKKFSVLDDENEASMAASLISGAVARLGYTARPEAILERIGSLGVEVVRLNGGWAQVCHDLTDFNLSTMKAQWRREALAVIQRRKMGYGDSVPRLPGETSNGETQALLAELSAKVTMIK